jgi:membrane fusion protein, multidrug efflux system
MRAALPALAALPFLPACRDSGPQAAAPEPPRPVQVAEIRFAPAEQPRAFAGVIRARREVDIAFRAGGRIATRLVDVGATVVAGQELARLDPADLALSLRAAEADLAAAEAQARQALERCRRSRALLAAGHVAAAFDDQRQAAAQRGGARGLRPRVARAGAQPARSHDAARAGRWRDHGAARRGRAGGGRGPGRAAHRRPVRAGGDGAACPKARCPACATRGPRRASGRGPTALAARLREVAPQADGMLRTYAARFALPEAPDWAALGMTGTIRLSAESAPVATLPLGALHDRGQGPMVWRVEGARMVGAGARGGARRDAGRSAARCWKGRQGRRPRPAAARCRQPVRVVQTRAPPRCAEGPPPWTASTSPTGACATGR